VCAVITRRTLALYNPSSSDALLKQKAVVIANGVDIQHLTGVE